MKNNKEPASTCNTSELSVATSSKSKNNTITLFDAINDFQVILQKNNLRCSTIYADKGIQRFKLESDKGNAKSGWYIFHTNIHNFAAAYGNWKTGLMRPGTSAKTTHLYQLKSVDSLSKFMMMQKRSN